MELKEVVKNAFVLAGYSGAGKWEGDMVYPIPELWDKSRELISKYKVDRIVGVCLPPRSDHYSYTCGVELESVNYYQIEQGMTVHTFPEQKYVVALHKGDSNDIPTTYVKLWESFDREGYRIKKGLPEIEIVKGSLFGKEHTDEYEMEIWIPVE